MDADVIIDHALPQSDRGGSRNGGHPTILQRPRVDRFSTKGLRDPDRIELWEQHNARALVALEAETLNGAVLEATELNLRLGAMQFAQVSANAHVVRRDERQIGQTPQESIAFYFTIFGESFFYTEDGVHLQHPGGLLVCDTSRPFMRGFAKGLEEFVLTVPKPLFEQLSENPAPLRPVTMHFARNADANAFAGELARLVRTLLRGPAAERESAQWRTAELIRQIFSPDARRTSTRHRSAALAYIDRHLTDRRLTLGAIAAHVGISERHLSRIFSETDSGVARIILDRRLDLARRLLSSPGAPAVGEIAQHCGFSSHAHFTRVFRERFEETPTRLRARANEAS